MATTEINVRVVPCPEHAGELTREKSTERLKDRIHELASSIGEIANDLREKLEVTLDQPAVSRWTLNEVSLSFSIDLESEAGVVVAKAKASAGFEAQLTWSRKDTTSK